MKTVKIALCTLICLICYEPGVAQHPAEPIANFHAGVHSDVRAVKRAQQLEVSIAAADFCAGVHSGSWTLERELLMEAESKDPYRSCPDPYCARCAKHLADYGHEYQYVGGPCQRQLWYRGTAGNVAIVTQRGYDQHGLPYRHRGSPASAIISWEYLQTLNHAIMEQVYARNAVATEEAARDRIILLTQLLADAKEQLRLTEEAWNKIEPLGVPCEDILVTINSPSKKCCKKTYKQFSVEMKACQFDAAQSGMCTYCLAQARYLFDMAYVADVENELALARCYLIQQSAAATEAVRLALLSKEDADKATRFKRFQYKPPKYREVLAARGVPESEPASETGEKTIIETSL